MVQGPAVAGLHRVTYLLHYNKVLRASVPPEMRMKQKIWLWGLSLSLLASAAMGNPVQNPHTRAELVSEAQLIQPGVPFWVGLRLTPEEGWHTYWRNPGDSGLPASIEWTMPEGFSASEIVWPAPRLIPYGPLMDYGYLTETVLLVEITPSNQVPVGTRFALGAHAQWLICEEICIPEEAELVLPLRVSSGGASDATTAPLFAAARAALPAPLPWPGSFAVEDDELVIRLSGAAGAMDSQAQSRLIPYLGGLIDNVAEQPVEAVGADAFLFVRRAGAALPERIEGVVLMNPGLGGAGEAYYANLGKAEFTVPAKTPAKILGVPAGGLDISLFSAAIFAFIGGLLLNLMPCVFPILSLKALALVGGTHETLGNKRAEGLSYTAGVLASFLAVAGVLLAVRAGGTLVGWGFQLQSPVFVSVMAMVLFVVGLSLSGYVVLGGRFMGAGGSLAAKSGHAGAFFTGVLATVVATPCTAPFMAPAIGYALGQTTIAALAVFASLGLGMAFPFLLVSMVPGLGRALPKPGLWLERFRQFLAFPIYATVIWLVWVLGRQAGINGAAALLAALLCLPFVIWLWRSAAGATRTTRVLAYGVIVLMVLGAAGLVRFAASQQNMAGQQQSSARTLAWETYSDAKLADYLATKAPVFVNFTADWCITCLANEQIALDVASVRGLFKERGIRTLKADWTRRDPEIAATLARFGRSGVPLYLFYPAGASTPVILPQILTPGILIEAVGG